MSEVERLEILQEIEITPEMIAAGANELASFVGDIMACSEEGLLIRVSDAILRAALRSPPIARFAGNKAVSL